MNGEQYDRLITDEGRARTYLTNLCFPERRCFCPRCRCDILYRLRDGRYRCSQCKYTFHEFSGRWINHGRLSAVQWLQVASYFQKGRPVLQMVSPLGLSYGSLYEAVRTIRLSIVARGAETLRVVAQNSVKGKTPFSVAPSDYRKVPVFAIWRLGEEVRVGMPPHFTADTLIGLSGSMDRFGSIVFVGDIIGFEGFVFYEPPQLRRCRLIPLRVDKKLARKNQGFWGLAKRNLTRYHGVTYHNFPLYLKEMEFRFNNRSPFGFIENLLRCLCDLKPEYTRSDAFRVSGGNWKET